MSIFYRWIIVFRDFCRGSICDLDFGYLGWRPHSSTRWDHTCVLGHRGSHSRCLCIVLMSGLFFQLCKGLRGRSLARNLCYYVCPWKTWLCIETLIFRRLRERERERVWGYGVSDRVSVLKQLPHLIGLSEFFLKCASPSGYLYCLCSWLILNWCQHLLLSWFGKLSNLTLHIYCCPLMMMVILYTVASDLTMSFK